MMRILTFAALLALSAPVVASAAKPDGSYHIFGGGTCGAYIAHSRSQPGGDTNSHALILWVQGYLTAYINFVAPDGDITAGTDYEGVTLWVDNYCQAHPLDGLADAAAALVLELKARKR